jgi:hypothetical protein
MEIANRFTDGEDAYNNKKRRSSEVDKTSRKRRWYRNGDNHGRQNQIAAGYDERNEQGYESKEFQARGSRGKEKPRYSGPSAEDMLYGPVRIHYAYLDGKRVSNHQMKDCKTFWYVSNVSIIFDAPCLFLHHLPCVSLHFVAFLCDFQN